VTGPTEFGTQSELILTLSNVGEETLEINALTPGHPALEARLYGSHTLPPGSQRSLRLILDRTNPLIAALRGARSTTVVLDTTIGARHVQLNFNGVGALDFGPLTVQASVIPSNLGFAERRTVQAVASLDGGYSFVLDLNLAALSLRAGDMVVVRVSATPTVEIAGCANARIAGELRFPLGDPFRLAFEGQVLESELVCGVGGG
jgi:hypothetical protein